MKISVTGNVVAITSEIKVDDIQLLSKAKKNSSLKVYDEKKEKELFAVGYTKKESGSIAEFGVTFNTANKDGNAMVTTLVPGNVADVKDWVTDLVTPIKPYIEKLEKSIAEDAKAIRENKATIASSIEIK